MYYITLDLEWNQAYAQKQLAVQKQLSCRLRGEVIQIGAVKLDRNMRICGSFSIIVKPMYFKKIHRHVSELTGISQQQMDRGVPLTAAAESFRTFCGDDFAFLTWGPDDVPMLKDNFRIHGMDSSWLDRTFDLQTIFNRQTDGETRQRSLEYAMEHFQIPQNLPAHDALNDAYFTALVAQKLDVNAGVCSYNATSGNFLESSVIGDADGGDDGYVAIHELLEDDLVAHPVCPICSAPLTAQDKCLHSRGQRYTFLFRCRKHGEMFLTLKLHRNFNDTWRAKREIKEADEEGIADFRRKLADTVSRKKTRVRKSSRRRKSRAKEDGATGAPASES